MKKNTRSIWTIKNTEIPESLRAWIEHAGSFMQRLIQHQVDNARIEVVRQTWLRPTVDESRLLELEHGIRALVREVLILSEEKQWMFARTVIPRKTLTGEEVQLAHLKERPLGSVLFKDPTMKRSAFEFACFKTGDQGHAKITQLVKKALPDLWARRSLFTLHEKSLLLTEVFLPDIATL